MLYSVAKQRGVVRGLYRTLDKSLADKCTWETNDFTVDGRSKHTQALLYTCLDQGLFNVDVIESYKKCAGSNENKTKINWGLFFKKKRKKYRMGCRKVLFFLLSLFV